MSSMMRGVSDSSTRSSRETPFDGIFRRMVNLPRSILGGVSRVMGQSMDLIGVGGRTNRCQQPDFPWPSPPIFPSQQLPLGPPVVQEEWAFLSTYEQEYGTTHPFFYACRFLEALKMAQDENKFLFVYLHSPEHPFTPPFCAETLRSELVVQFLDANFVSWGGLANRGEGLQMATTLRASGFPFCALVAPSSGDSIAVLQQVEGPISPAELVGLLQTTMEEQGLAFSNGRRREPDRRRVDRLLREEQDAAYLAALKIDQEKETLKRRSPERKPETQVANKSKVHNEKQKQKLHGSQASQSSKMKEATHSGDLRIKDLARQGKNAQVIQILIRFPKGERREQSFLSTDKIQSIYQYIDSLNLAGVGGNYRLVSSFPRKVFGVEQMGMTLKDAGIQTKASLFLELLDFTN